MRRGLLAWDRDEVPAAALDARVERLRDAAHAAGLDALLIYNNFPRPAAVSWLTHFVPYWSQGVLLIPREGPPAYFVSLSKRVAGWIADTSHLGEIVSTPRLGADLAKRLAGTRLVGVVERDRFPSGIARPLLEGLPNAVLDDATGLFRAARHPADAAEIAVSKTAAALARDQLDIAFSSGSFERTGALTAAIEGPARMAGAEEVLIELAPDLDRDTVLRRIDGDLDLGERYAVRASLAYKGHWVRVGGTSDADEERAARALQLDLSGRPIGQSIDGFEIQDVVFESCVGSLPLTRVETLPTGAVGTVNLVLSAEGKICLMSAPVLEDGGSVSPLI